MSEPAIFIEGAATETLYLGPVPTPATSPTPPGDDPFGIIYLAAGDALSPTAGHPYFREAGNGATHDLLEPDLLTNGSFVTVLAEPGLAESRKLAAGARLVIADGGAQGSITVSVDAATDALLGSLGVASFLTAETEASLPSSRKLDVSTRLVKTDNPVFQLFTIAIDPATDVLLTNLSAASFFTRSPEPALPNTWQLAGSPNITLSTVSVSPNVVVPTLVGITANWTMNWDFTDGVIPIPNAFSNKFRFYKLGQIVYCEMFGTGGYTSPSLLPSQISTVPGTEIPPQFRPFGSLPIVQASVLIQNIIIGGVPVPPLTTDGINACAFDAFGVVAPNYLGISGATAAPVRTWFPLNIIDWEPQFFSWIGPP